MALIKEDGTGKEDAQTYADLVELRAYSLLRGVDLSALADPAAETLLVKAMDYLQSLEYVGEQLTEDQALKWPRSGVPSVTDPEVDRPSDVIPKSLINAQMQLALEARTLELMPSSDGRQVLKRKVDVIETVYAESSSGASPSFPLVDSYLKGLLVTGLSGMTINSVRV